MRGKELVRRGTVRFVSGSTLRMDGFFVSKRCKSSKAQRSVSRYIVYSSLREDREVFADAAGLIGEDIRSRPFDGKDDKQV